MKKINKIISGVLAALMIFTSVPVYATNENISKDTSETISNEIISSKTNPDTNNPTEEVPLDNWELDVVFYDSSVGQGKTALKEINWDVVNEDETRVITMQINYKNTNTVTNYAPGTLKIKVPNLGQQAMKARNSSNGSISSAFDLRKYYELDAVTADPFDSKTKEYDWSYTKAEPVTNEYNGEDYIPYYTFINNNQLEEKSNFEGSLQISYVFKAQEVFQSKDIKLNATLNETLKSNDITFNFSSPKAVYDRTTFSILPPLKSSDGLPSNANDYIWVKYKFNMYHDNIRTLNNYEYRINVPDTCYVLDVNMNPANKNSEGNYIIDIVDRSVWSASYLYIGYPINEFEGKTISQTAELWGDYCDNKHSKNSPSNPIEFVKDFNIGNIVLDKFKFNYNGDAMGIDVYKVFTNSSYNLITKSSAHPEFKVNFDATNPGYKYALRVGMDIFGITDLSQNFVFLDEKEYSIKKIDIENPLNLNDSPYPKNSLDFDVYVRYRGEKEFVKEGSYKNEDEWGMNIWFDNGKPVVDFYVLYRNLTQGIKLRDSDYIRAYLDVSKKENVPKTGKIFGFGYIERYAETDNGLELKSSITLDNYASGLAKNTIAPYDMEHYGHYVQRDFYGIEYEDNDNLLFEVYNFEAEVMENTTKERVEFKNDIIMEFNPDSSYVDNLYGFKTYFLLPEGVSVNGGPNDIISSMSSRISGDVSLLKINGKQVASEHELIEYIKAHTTVKTTENWKNTNRTKVELDSNLTDGPIFIDDLFSKNIYCHFEISLSLPMFVSYDNLEEFGLVYPNYVYMDVYPSDIYTVKPHGFSYEGKPCSPIKDDGTKDPQAADINENGNTEDKLCTSLATTTINHVIASYQDVTVQVKSDKSNYNTGIVDTSNDAEYTYKLRVRTGKNSITNLIIYDNIEEAFENNKYWQGELLGVDTSFAENRGYKVKVFYSENKKAGKLSEDNSWKEYSESVDKKTVKSLAFQYLDDKGNPAVIPDSSLTYVLVKMKAPQDPNLRTLAYNQINTEWNAIDENGHTVDFITGINSNIVKVALPNSNKEIGGFSLNFNKEILNSNNQIANNNDYAAKGINIDNPLRFKLVLTNVDTQEYYSGNLDSKTGLIINEIPVAKYKIEELDDNYTDFVSMGLTEPIEGVTLKKEGDSFFLSISDGFNPEIPISIKVTNKLESNEVFYEYIDTKENLFAIK